MESLAPEKLTSLRRIATIESVGSSTRIEGAKLSDREVEKLLSGVKAELFASRDEQEVAGYADATAASLSPRIWTKRLMARRSSDLLSRT